MRTVFEELKECTAVKNNAIYENDECNSLLSDVANIVGTNTVVSAVFRDLREGGPTRKVLLDMAAAELKRLEFDVSSLPPKVKILYDSKLSDAKKEEAKNAMRRKTQLTRNVPEFAVDELECRPGPRGAGHFDIFVFRWQCLTARQGWGCRGGDEPGLRSVGELKVNGLRFRRERREYFS